MTPDSRGVMERSKGVNQSGRVPDVPSAFDAERLRAELAEWASLRGIVLDTLSELPRHIPHLRRSLDEGRWESLATHARRLAQLFSSLMAFPASEAAERLRFAAEAVSPESEEALERLAREIERLACEMAAHFDIVL